ncbi:MAG: CBASS cGAMP-activated phospholipase [Saprospiraceae bacterium]|nr:CBASS cGAMP-activated phospholipase [Saprospiraceae bacterium]
MDSTVFKILTIDGGGVKGLYSATILNKFEDYFGKRCTDCFDLICGTSTGGLIAMALSLKIPASHVVGIYENRSAEIFPAKSKLRRLFRQIIWRGIHTDKGLIRVLDDLFGDRTLSESNNLLCIPSFSFTEYRPVVFRRDHSDLFRHNQLKYKDVALATSAAPTYLPMAELSEYDHKQMIDGGVWANNPALVGLAEALRYFVGEGKPYDQIQLLSIPSLNARKGNPLGMRRERSFLDWKGDIIRLVAVRIMKMSRFRAKSKYGGFCISQERARMEGYDGHGQAALPDLVVTF